MINPKDPVSWASPAACCLEQAISAFVQYGSYFTRCTSCGANGPATSWLAIWPLLTNRISAVVVDGRYEEVSFVAEGEGNKIAEKISVVAHQGKLVRLVPSITSA
jgi:hypothetical protein